MTFKNSEIPNVPPMPTSPDHPERPPRNIPIPGEPTAAGETHKHEYKCKECGKIFNSKKELEIHMKTEHTKEHKMPKKNWL